MVQQKPVEENSSSASPNTSVSHSSKRKHLDEEALSYEVGDRDGAIVHHNSPFLMTVYKDPDTLGEEVCACVNLPSGATDVKFTLLGTGPATSAATVSYIWQPIMYTVEGLFTTEIKKSNMSATHPTVIAVKTELENHRGNIETKPRGSIELSLPIPVQTDPKTVSDKAGKTPNGVIVLIANLTAFHCSYTMKKAEFECEFQEF